MLVLTHFYLGSETTFGGLLCYAEGLFNLGLQALDSVFFLRGFLILLDP